MTLMLAVGRCIALVGLTLGLGVGQAFQRAVGRWLPSRGPAVSPDVALQRWAHLSARLIGMRLHVSGHIPTGPIALVANHLGYVDVVALSCLVPGAFVARADVAGWPVIGRLGRVVGTIFIERKRKRDLLRVIPEMQRVLESGRSVIFFPEGTSSRGEGVLPFRSPLFEAPGTHDVPIFAASVSFKTHPPAAPADESVAWWGDMDFAPHVFALLRISEFEARVRFSPVADPSAVFGKPLSRPPDAAQRSRRRKELCRIAFDAVRGNFEPTASCSTSTKVEVVPTGLDEACPCAGSPN